MTKIAVIGCGNAGQILVESLQQVMPDAEFVVVNELDIGKSSTVKTWINTSLKRRLTNEELCEYAVSISKYRHLELPGDSYWWFALESGTSNFIKSGIALVRDEAIVTWISGLLTTKGAFTRPPNPLERFDVSSGGLASVQAAN